MSDTVHTVTNGTDCTAFSVSNFFSAPGSLWHQTGQAAQAVNTAALSICSTSFFFRRGSQWEKSCQWGERVPNWSSQLCLLNLFFFFEWFKDTRENVLLVSFAFLGTAVTEVLIFWSNSARKPISPRCKGQSFTSVRHMFCCGASTVKRTYCNYGSKITPTVWFVLLIIPCQHTGLCIKCVQFF